MALPPDKSSLQPWQRIAAIVFIVCLLVVPLYCAFIRGEGEAPPNPPTEEAEPAPAE